jgi:phosphate-selective porin OprO and OprP
LAREIKPLGAAIMAIACCLGAGICRSPAQEAALPRPTFLAPEPVVATGAAAESVEARLDRLERENQKLQETVKGLKGDKAQSPGAAPKGAAFLWETFGLIPAMNGTTQAVGPPPFYLMSLQPNTQDAGTGGKAPPPTSKGAGLEVNTLPAKDEDKEFVVGANANLQARWANLLMFEARDGAFVFHVGGRDQFDPVWVDANRNVMSGPGATAPYLDGMGFRRARLQADATAYEVIDMKAEFDFVNTTTISNKTFNVPVITDLWMQFRELPGVGNIRAGYVKPQISLEHLTSSRFLEFMERSYNFDAFTSNENNGFQPGVYAFNWTEDMRATAALGFYKTDQSIFAWSVGHGYNTSGRVTWLPLWEDDGREYIHLGLSGGWGGTANGVDLIRARGLIRNGPSALQPVMAIANLQANTQGIINPEFLLNIGPFSLQAEYNGTLVQDVTNIIQTPTQTNVPVDHKSFYSQGGYVEALYFLTGEYRPYNRYEAAPWRVLPYRSFFYVRGMDGHNLFSSGAWQVGVRYSYLNLNNNGINGGELDAGTLGLNWYLNPNFKIQWNYSADHRYIPNSPASGFVHAFGMRFAWDF